MSGHDHFVLNWIAAFDVVQHLESRMRRIGPIKHNRLPGKALQSHTSPFHVPSGRSCGHALRSSKASCGQPRSALRGQQAANVSVEQRAQELSKLNDLLRQTQFELMQHEKMSMLGQLASGVAHEVNTPAGAILNSSVDAGRHLREFLSLTLAPEGLSDETRKWLSGLFEAMFSEGPTRSDMAARQERRHVDAKLREEGYLQARRMAEVIVGYNKHDLLEDKAALEQLSQEPALGILEHALALKVAAEISEVSAKKIARIVRSLRLYAHSGQGEPADIDVNDSIDSMLLVLQNKIKRTARVETHYAADLPTIKCGADLLQVWTNILSNACDAIDLARRDNMGLIEVTTAMEGDWVVARISNDGPPIAPEHLEKLFTPFFTTKGLGKGTGLGLSICRGILKRYNASITAANEPGRVTFEVRLPKVQKTVCEAAITNHALAGNLAAGGGSKGLICLTASKSA